MVRVRIIVCLLNWILRCCRRRIFIVSGVGFSNGSGGLICLVVLVLKVVCISSIIDMVAKKWRMGVGGALEHYSNFAGRYLPEFLTFNENASMRTY